ncbi:hypothetical protein PR048_032961 [Dryococelus australis]|uniref:HTH CENPB-type domain-containing protein n=1 Tax=Dryococelus australis TaxID=614101 RepID=A0ABQ9G3Q6_9NEOP|nr:hypothetical protein PR048_032961 [Dryococelus australis]
MTKCSTGWLERFKKRNVITWHKIVGESAEVPCGMVEPWLQTAHKILERSHTCGQRGNRSKENHTVLLCTNMDGSDKVMLFVVGKKVVLFINNCPAHPTELVFLPPNTTSVLQPMDQGTILLVKKKFCDMLVHDMVVRIDINQPQRKKDVLRAIRAICTKNQERSWKRSTTTLTVCLPKMTNLQPNLATKQLRLSRSSLQSPNLLPKGVPYEDYLAIDDTPAWGASDEENLISGHKESTDRVGGGRGCGPKPTREDVLEAIEMLTNGILHTDADSEVWTSSVHLKKWVITSYGKKKQASRTKVGVWTAAPKYRLSCRIILSDKCNWLALCTKQSD